MYLSEYLLTGDPAKDWETITPCGWGGRRHVVRFQPVNRGVAT